jgi:hypothetical protein
MSSFKRLCVRPDWKPSARTGAHLNVKGSPPFPDRTASMRIVMDIRMAALEVFIIGTSDAALSLFRTAGSPSPKQSLVSRCHTSESSSARLLGTQFHRGISCPKFRNPHRLLCSSSCELVLLVNPYATALRLREAAKGVNLRPELLSRHNLITRRMPIAGMSRAGYRSHGVRALLHASGRSSCSSHMFSHRRSAGRVVRVIRGMAKHRGAASPDAVGGSCLTHDNLVGCPKRPAVLPPAARDARRRMYPDTETPNSTIIQTRPGGLE